MSRSGKNMSSSHAVMCVLRDNDFDITTLTRVS